MGRALVVIYMVSAILFTGVVGGQGQWERKERPSALYHGDFIIGALYSIHHQPKQKKSGITHFLDCGGIREVYGIQRTEVTFHILDKINRDPRLLPNITLGAEIRDSCWYAPVSLQQTIELIRDSITPVTSTVAPCLTNLDTQVAGGRTNQRSGRGTLIGVVGPGSSSVAMQVQNLLQLFSIPQVAYSATSRDLSDKSRFSSFLRVVPSDYHQAKVLVDIVKYHNWTYVSAVYTDENYGQSGIQAFREVAELANVCIAKEDSILSNAADEHFDRVIKKLIQDTNARVVVCFCEGMTVRGLLKAEKRLNITDKLLIVGSDGWADRGDVVYGYEEQAHGSISVRIHSPYVQDFDQHYLALKPHNNTRNPWFKEFWQSQFSCVLPEEYQEFNSVDGTKKPLCTGNESLKDYRQDSKMSFVIKALYTMAHGLHDMVVALCGENSGACPAMYPFNATLFKSYLMNVSFTTAEGESVQFDEHGDPPGRYDIMNYQLTKDGVYEYMLVGKWKGGDLTFNKPIQYGPSLQYTSPSSVCSRPCPPGSYKNFQTGSQEKRCCWACVKCDKHEILYNETTCLSCNIGWYPNQNQTVCLEVPEERVKWSDTQAIVAMIFSSIGIFSTIVTAAIFIKYNHTPVVKSSTRELSYLILAGMIISHVATFPILAKPAKVSCTLSRMMPGISFAMIYASLLTKTNRIARILAGSKKRFPTRKPRFMSGMAQVVISCLLIGLEVGIAIFMLWYEPADGTHLYPTRERSILSCNTTPIGVLTPLAFDFFLIILCTLYAIKTRNVPENFNEAKFIGFAMYTTCVIWVAFVPIYFGSESKIITMCLCVSLSATVTLVFLFIPKLYIIVFRPERNRRDQFITSKSIRCHIGSRVATALSDAANKEKKEQSSASWSHKSDIKPEVGETSLRKRATSRTLSCQTGTDLLEDFLQAQMKEFKKTELPDWAELNPKALMNTQPIKTGLNGTNPSPNLSVKTTLKPKQPAAPFLNPKARIREESVSECSLSDEDLTQIKSITITLGSTSSVNGQSLEKDMIGLRKTTSEVPLSTNVL